MVGEVKGVDELGVKSCVQGRTLSHLVRLQGIDNSAITACKLYTGRTPLRAESASPRTGRASRINNTASADPAAWHAVAQLYKLLADALFGKDGEGVEEEEEEARRRSFICERKLTS